MDGGVVGSIDGFDVGAIDGIFVGQPEGVVLGIDVIGGFDGNCDVR